MYRIMTTKLSEIGNAEVKPKRRGRPKKKTDEVNAAESTTDAAGLLTSENTTLKASGTPEDGNISKEEAAADVPKKRKRGRPSRKELAERAAAETAGQADEAI